MQVKVKKEVLINLFKKALNENRTFNNPSGNFIHAFDRQSSSPISASPHMATQLSVEEPPVQDENYVPASISELKAAAARIAQEVPPDQVEGYYRALHRLLDAALDKSKDSMIAEARARGGGFTDVMNVFDKGYDFDGRYELSAGKEKERVLDLGSASFTDKDENELKEEGLELLKNDSAFQTLVEKLKKDPFINTRKPIQQLLKDKNKQFKIQYEETFTEMYGLTISDVEEFLLGVANDTQDTEPSDKKSALTGQLAVEPTSIPGALKREPVSKTTVEPEEDEDDSDIDDEYEDRAFSRIKKSQQDELEIAREAESLTKRHRALTDVYWDKKESEVLKTFDPVGLVAQIVMDSMDAVSRTIATEVSVKYGFLGADVQKSFAGSPEEKSWRGILSNDINTNNEVLYTLPAEKKTKSFWEARVIAFIDKLQSGNAGSLTPFSKKFEKIARDSLERYEYEVNDTTGDALSFLQEVADRVVATILSHPVYGATTRNVASSSDELLTKTIDTAFSSQLKKAPFSISNRATFDSRVAKGEFDPNALITHAGEEKTTKDAVVDAIVAYVIVKSQEFKKERRDLDPELSNEAKDSAIQQIVANLKDNETFTYSEGTGENKQSFVISKSDIVQDVRAYVDQKFLAAAASKESDIEFEETDVDSNYLEDPSVSEKEKKERFTDEIASQIMRNTGSVASYRDYFNRVIMNKFKFATQGLKDLEDPETQDEVNYIQIFNDTLGEMISPILTALEEMLKELIGKGLTVEDLEPFIEGIAQIRAFEKIVYSRATRGGEETIQSLAGNIIKIDDDEYDAFDFFAEGRNTGPAILRQIVSDIIGATLKGSGMGNIPTINFKFEEKVKRQAENIEDYLLKEIKKLFGGIDLKVAQDVSFATGTQLGLDESKAKFLEPNGRDLQLKMIYPFVGRVKKMPDFRAMNPPAKNFVCWFSAIADKQHGGAATMDERKAVAEKLFNLLMKMGAGEMDDATKEVKKIIDTTEKIVSKKFSEIEALEAFTSDEVKRIRKNPELMRKIVLQAMKMHLEDIGYFEDNK